MRYLNFLLLAALSAGMTTFVNAQDQNNLALDAIVRDLDGGKLTGVKIKIFQDGTLVDQMSTGKNGRFDVLLDFDHQFLIEMSKSGYVAKRIQVNTKNVPEDEQAWGYEYGGLSIDLFKEIESIDYSLLDGPIAKFYYDPNLQNFDYDKLYTKQIKQELDELEDEYERKLKMAEQMDKQAEKDYELAMRDAENALRDGDLMMAKENYLAAASLKPGASDPQKKLSELEEKMNAEAGKEEQYLSTLADADQLFGQEKFGAAQAKYEEASSIKPNEQYPKDRIAESKVAAAAKKAQAEAEALLAEKDRKYNAEISKADKELAEKNYANAKTYYQNALGFKPDEKYPSEQLQQIELKLEEELASKEEAERQAKLDEQYNAIIAKADAAFNSSNYDNARSAYTEASALKPSEEYPKAQIALIAKKETELANALADKEKAAREQEQYQANINSGDKAFKQKDFDLAITSYQEALSIRANDEYATKQLAEIESIKAQAAKEQQALSAQQEIDEKYASAIKSADEAINKKQLAEAIDAYKDALAVKPNETYPKNQIDKLEKQLADDEQNQKFAAIIKEADASFDDSDYEAAKSKYNQALAIKPNDKYANKRLSDIDTAIAAAELSKQEREEQEALDANYTAAVNAADDAFKSESYDLAKENYTKAKSLKPSEGYPQEQLLAIEKLINEAKASEELATIKRQKQEAYEAKIKEADGQFNDEDWEKARITYNAAAAIMPDQKYPKDQISAIDKKVDSLAASKNAEADRLKKEKEAQEMEAKYAAFIKTADGYLNQEDYIKAKSAYQQAASINNSASYPTDQIAKIEAALLEIANAEKFEEDQRKQYNQYITDGDRAVASQDWGKARESFNAALGIYSDEDVPKARLKEIDALEQKAKDEKQNAEIAELIRDADKFFVTKELEAAESKYQAVLDLDKTNQHAKVRLDKIKQIRAAQSEEAIAEKDKPKRTVKEENYKEGNADVTVRTVTEGERVDTYKRVKHSWGGKYFFLNDQPISELVWNRDSVE